ncbi:energy-coupling factor transporter transmembrane component T family protein [Thermosulfuriphilus sp.]
MILFALARPSWSRIKLTLVFVAFTAWGIMFSQGMFYQCFPRTVLFTLVPPLDIGNLHLGGLYVYKQGIYYGLIQSLRFISGLLAGLSLCLSTPPDKLFWGLIGLRIPYGLSFLSIMAIRFLPVIAEEMANVRAAMRLKGYRPLSQGIRRTITTELASPLPILAGAVRRSREVAEALLTRGFDPLKPRSHYRRLIWPRRELALSLSLFFLALAVATLKILFWLYQQEIFYFSPLRHLYSFFSEILSLGDLR